jgi:hypothetical protein
VNLLHRHGDAAAQAGEGQQCMFDIGRQADGLVGIADACSFNGVEYGPPPQNEGEGQHRGQAKDADADVGLAPASRPRR